MKQFRKAVFHVGTDKTGSTALQTSMDAMRDALVRRHQVAYLPGPVHHMLGSYFSAEPERLEFNIAEALSSRSAIQDRDRAYLTAVEQFLQTAGECETLLVSFEGFYCLAEETLHSLVAWANSQAESVTALMYVRQPHAYAVSAISQRVFGGQAATSTTPLPRVNIGKALTRLQRGFGQGRVLVRAYEASQLIGGDIVSDCLHAIGAEEIIGAPDYVRGERINTQMSREAAAFGNALMTALTESGGKAPDRKSWRKYCDLIAAMPGHRIQLTPTQGAELSDVPQSDLSLLKAAYGIEFQEPASTYIADSDHSAETAMINAIARVVATMIPHEEISDSAAGHIELGSPLPAISTGMTVPLHLTLFNDSTAEWLSTAEHPIRVGYRYRDMAGRRTPGKGRTPLPGGQLVAKGSVPLVLTVKAPEEPGEYVLEISVVQEHLRWLEQIGFTPYETSLTVG